MERTFFLRIRYIIPSQPLESRRDDKFRSRCRTKVVYCTEFRGNKSRTEMRDITVTPFKGRKGVRIKYQTSHTVDKPVQFISHVSEVHPSSHPIKFLDTTPSIVPKREVQENKVNLNVDGHFPTSVYRFQQIHLRIIFHLANTNMICRLCLQRIPRRVFIVSASNTSISGMVNHCEENHQDMCDHLFAMSEVQLDEMARRLDACKKE
ncbi:hypothetical protein BDZ94DRAFT_256356 [Collybia nuda]|uniref:Uncharacterized protein n=1 Tax=Collybia nuda TaxID=64659 RepID=A0A9P5XT65_9AGAR|nr:hypothetical protein BDZ94DRAFT_256356 [Collybia nuda]